MGGSGGGAAVAPPQSLTMAYYPEPVARLIEALQRLPGIGPKTAQRLTFFLLKRPADEVKTLAESLTQLKELIVHCRICFNVTQEDPCRICSDQRRDQRILCIVEEPNDLLALERPLYYAIVDEVDNILVD